MPVREKESQVDIIDTMSHDPPFQHVLTVHIIDNGLIAFAYQNNNNNNNIAVQHYVLSCFLS